MIRQNNSFEKEYNIKFLIKNQKFKVYELNGDNLNEYTQNIVSIDNNIMQIPLLRPDADKFAYITLMNAFQLKLCPHYSSFKVNAAKSALISSTSHTMPLMLQITSCPNKFYLYEYNTIRIDHEVPTIFNDISEDKSKKIIIKKFDVELDCIIHGREKQYSVDTLHNKLYTSIPINSIQSGELVGKVTIYNDNNLLDSVNI